MLAMLPERCLKVLEQLLGLLRGMSAALEPGDKLDLPSHMPLSLSDMVVDHSEVGRAICHDEIYHLPGRVSRSSSMERPRPKERI